MKRLPEELVKYLKDHKQNLIPDYISEPTYFFKVGDEVIYGAMDKSIVLEVLSGGLYYHLEVSGERQVYSKKVSYLEERFVVWHEIRPLLKTDVIIKQNTDTQVSMYNRNVRGLLSMCYNGGVDFNVEYQREHVWTLEDKQALIHSIFNNVEIGKIAFALRPIKYVLKHKIEIYEVVDGKQRLTALLEFYENRFPLLTGQHYNDLSGHDQNHFDTFQITTAEMQDPTYEQKLRYFVNVNSGRVMDKAHLDKVKEMLKKEQNKKVEI